MIFKDQVYWYKKNGRDKFGGIEYDDPILLDCRIEEITKRGVDRQGEFYLSQFRIFFKDIIDIAIGDKIEIEREDYIVNEVHIEKDYFGNKILVWVMVREI